MLANDDAPARQSVIDRIREFFDRLFGRPDGGQREPAASAATAGGGGRSVKSPPRKGTQDTFGWGLAAA